MAYEELVASLHEPSTRGDVADRLRVALPASQEALLAGLRHGPPSVRRWSALVLDHAPHDGRVEEALQAAVHDPNRKVRRAALHSLACAECKPDGCLTTDGVGFLVDALLGDRSIAVRRTCAGVLMWGQQGRPERVTAAFRQLLVNHDTDPVLRARAVIYLFGWGVPGCLACDLSRGRQPLPGGIVHAGRHWLVEHSVGPLGIGTLVVKPGRHVVRLVDMSGDEAAELGPLLARSAEVVTALTAPNQVYACMWSHGPVHIHFVVQPVGETATCGPTLQAQLFEAGGAPGPHAVEAFAEAARRAFAERLEQRGSEADDGIVFER